MAEDALIGFDFTAREDNFEKDAAVRATSDVMFSELGFEGQSRETFKSKSIQESVEISDDVESFDFTEAFDFMF